MFVFIVFFFAGAGLYRFRGFRGGLGFWVLSPRAIDLGL